MEYPVLDPIAIGTRIRELRMVHHFKVEDIAEFMGFESVQAVYKWQRGESLPTVDNLYALSILLETSMEYILIGKSYERDESPSLSFYRVILTIKNAYDNIHSINICGVDEVAYEWERA